MLYQPVVTKLVGAVDQVFPHEVFGEREGRERKFLDDFETRNLPYLPADDFENARDIDPALVARQLALKLRDAKVEVPFQKLKQGRVYPYVVFMVRNPERRLGRSALKTDRDEDERGAIGAGIAFGFLPSEKPRSEKERVRAAFLHVASGAPVKRQQAVVHLLAGERDNDLSALERIANDLFLDPLRFLWRDRPAAEGIVVAEGEPPEFLSAGKLVFKVSDARTAQGDGLLAVPVIEETVSKRQVE